MSTIIIATLIALAVVLSIRSFIKKKGACGDSGCSCPIKDEMQKASKIE